MWVSSKLDCHASHQRYDSVNSVHVHLPVQSLSVLSRLGHILEQQLCYTQGVHYLRLDGSVSGVQYSRAQVM